MSDINKLSDDQVEVQFSELIRDKMDSRKFWDWVAEWYDPAFIIEQAENWETPLKRDLLLEWETTPMFVSLYLTADELNAIEFYLDVERSHSEEMVLQEYHNKSARNNPVVQTALKKVQELIKQFKV